MNSKALLSCIRRKPEINGFAGMSELVIAAGVGTLLIMASGVALQSTGTLIKQSEDKTTLRQNSTNGLRLMRSEVERSMHLVLNQSNSFPEDQAHINLSDSRYTSMVANCRALAGTRLFKPLFGVKMIELNQPVLYGMSMGSGGFTIERCGAPLDPDGKYNETSKVFLSRVLEGIGAIPCRKESELKEGESLSTVCEEEGPSKAEILSTTDFAFTAGQTPSRTERQPALRIQTDTNYKLVKFIDPTAAEEGEDEDAITESFINKLGVGDRRVTYQPLYFTAFARADKRVDNFGEEGQGGPLSGAFFQNITSSNVRFVIDGSGSMSACVMWGDGYGSWRTFYDPNEGRYRDTRRICALTRMEALISEMTMILDQLPNNTKVGLTSFSSRGYGNHKEWSESQDGLVRLGDDGKRDSAIEFVNSLDNERVTQWGGTDPWNAIQKAFDDTEADTLYLMSDGRPNRDRNGGNWSSWDHQSTADYYAGENDDRQYDGKDRALIVNTTSFGLESPWLEKLSGLTQGYYNQIDKDSLQEGQDENS
ncbi:vWA domain-containing protein [Synechococcus sp. RS9916]|uniref:vWA domain-containing protein n=1 Tax=Synechococcus sp. RS9916 TaxID=221359 RepID=UPI000571E740|nr:vWA domain-containing protein [Synechococcus sp. RS9916]